MTESCRYFKSSATTTKRIVEKNWVFFFFFVSVASSNIICNTGTVTFQEIRKWKNILFSFPTMWKNSVKMQGKNLKSNISFDKLNFFEKNKMCFLRQEFNTLFSQPYTSSESLKMSILHSRWKKAQLFRFKLKKKESFIFFSSLFEFDKKILIIMALWYFLLRSCVLTSSLWFMFKYKILDRI